MIKVMKVKSSIRGADGEYMPLYPDAQLPKASHPGTSLAWDLYAVEDGKVPCNVDGDFIAPVVTVHTGIAVEAQPMACGFLIKERSSQGKQGIIAVGGVIDADYRGEIMVMLKNLGAVDYNFKKGDRIAQMICIPTLTGQPVSWYDELSSSERGEGGFGSTGV